jgi:predicted PolB exonuclease-like 3'-5' exonuclease
MSTDAPAAEPAVEPKPDKPQVRYLIFDTEAVADGELVGRIRFPNESLSPQEAIRKYRQQVSEERYDGKDILPVTFMLPISVALAKVDAEFRLLDVVVLDAPLFRPWVITEKFWKGWWHYRRPAEFNPGLSLPPTLVSFNGRMYDIPLLELAAFRFGQSVPQWFNVFDKSYEQARNRYNLDAHLDLNDVLTNYSAFRLSGGLNLMANLLGKPGKTGVDGSQVQDMYNEGRLEEINNYCRCDVLDTYFVFLRSQVLLGRLKLDDEQARVQEAKAYLETNAECCPAYAHYLEHWGEWTPPEK